MHKTCSICGAETFAGARFCRRCGAPLRESGDGEEVSPRAATVPLADEGRSTGGFGAEEPSQAADTTRVSRAELERLLRAQASGDISAAELARRTDGGVVGHETLDPEATLIAADGGARQRVTRPPLEGRPGEEADEELTISVPRPGRTLDTRETQTEQIEPARVTTSPPGEPPPPDFIPAAPPTAAPANSAAGTVVPAARPRRRWPLVVGLCLASLLFVAAAAWLAARFWRPAAPTDLSTQPPAAPASSDPNQLLEEKVAEAEALLAQGNLEGALTALREANRLVPSNAKAHRRLGELLLEGGARREAIEEFRAVTRHDPNDFTAWRQLAAAQFAEGLHRDAADSYRRLVELVGEQSADPHDLLSYADALRLSGRPEEARAIYQRLSALPFADLAGAAGRRLAELAQPTPAPTPAGPPNERADAQPPAGETAPGTTPAQPTPAPPTPAPTAQAPPPAPPERAAEVSPAERYRRGVELWSSNRAAALDDLRAAAGAGNPDAHYYLGLGYVEGRNVQSLKRAEIVAALAHFQSAQRGQFAAQARRYTQQLEREFDRIRKK
jgi:tetratricopeptide (TPR) repeat protein